MHRPPHRAGWGRTTFWLMTGVIVSLWISGCVMYGLPLAELPDMSDAQAMLRRTAGTLHGVLAWLFCVMGGRGVWPHVRVMWHRHARRRPWLWGLANLALLLFLAVGGLALLYGSPWLHDLVAPWHFWTGLGGAALYLVHTWRRWVPSST
ncbi:MAG: hypothetical protein ACKOWC_01160 [Limnohabitans sp.]